jgi:hypothetical protein
MKTGTAFRTVPGVSNPEGSNYIFEAGDALGLAAVLLVVLAAGVAFAMWLDAAAFGDALGAGDVAANDAVLERRTADTASAERVKRM